MKIIKYLFVAILLANFLSLSAQNSITIVQDTIVIDYSSHSTFRIDIDGENVFVYRTDGKSLPVEMYYFEKIKDEDKTLKLDRNRNDTTRLIITGNNITKLYLSARASSYHIDLSKCNNLIELENKYCFNNLSSIKYTKLKTLKIFDVYSSNAELDLSNYLELEKLYIFDSDIDKIDLSNNKHLDTLQLIHTNINSLDLSQNKSLSHVLLRGNSLTPTAIKNILESLPINQANITKTIIIEAGISTNRSKGLLYDKNESIDFNFNTLKEKGWSLN